MASAEGRTGQAETDEAQKDGRLTLEHVKQVIRSVTPEDAGGRHRKARPLPFGAQASPLFLNRDLSLLAPLNPHDEIFPGLILSNHQLAMDKAKLHQLGVTHVLNASQGSKFNQVDTAAAYYADLGLCFMGINAMDTANFRLSQYFEPAAAFIHDTLTTKGCVVVHCHQGLSRSASLVLAYLMLRRQMGLLEAVRMVRRKRGVFPNDGFLKQLILLHHQLRDTPADQCQGEQVTPQHSVDNQGEEVRAQQVADHHGSDDTSEQSANQP